jgi:predicted transcriptional regulator
LSWQLSALPPQESTEDLTPLLSDIEKDTSLPRRTVQYALQTLTKKAFIQKLGQKAGTRYQLIF